MIRLRPRPATPNTLKSSRVARTRESIRQKVAAGESLTDKDFPSRHWLKDDVRLTLWRYQRRKCCYCERIREAKREPDIDHFRPKKRVRGQSERDLGYWWLAYTWTNLLFCCRPCNQLKSDHFPLLTGNCARTPEDPLAEERPGLIDPIMDDPENLIDFRWEFGPIVMAKPIGKDADGRGDRTIRLIGLDRLELNEERGWCLSSLKAITAKMMTAQYLGNPALREDAANDIWRATEAAQAFAGFRRAFFRTVNLGDYIADD